jgi:hypothetical protein
MKFKIISFFISFLIIFCALGYGLIAKENNEYELIIITPSSFTEELQVLADHKEIHGITTKIITLDEIYSGTYFPTTGRDDPEKIKYFIKNTKENWDTKYVMLVGGKSIMPVRFSRIWLIDGNYSYYISDLYYADLYFQNNSFCSWDTNNDLIFADKNKSGYIDEVDLYPDVYVGRILTNTEHEVEDVVDKIINYENTAYGSAWFKNLVLCGGDDARSVLIEAALPFLLKRFGFPVFEGEYFGNRAARILSDFNARKVYATGFLRLGVKALTTKNINDEISKGAGFLMFNGHGHNNTAMVTNFPFMKSKWLPKPNGYKSSDVEALTNGYKLPVAIFGGCLCGDYNENPSPVAWDFVAHKEGGAIASIAGTSGTTYCLSSLCTESMHGHMMMSIFSSYKEGNNILGKIWSDSITNFLDDEDALILGDRFSMLNWFHTLTNHFTIEIWTLLGDPSLKVGGYL